jgi:shikimate dehydrogenase
LANFIDENLFTGSNHERDETSMVAETWHSTQPLTWSPQMPLPSTSYPIITKTVPTCFFIGVTTKKSSIMKVFPLWVKELGRPEVVIEGVDLKIHDDPEQYRQAVAQIKYDPLSLGALVTTHKIDLLDASRDMFEYLDPYAQICAEVSSISKLEGRLEGHAKDPITSGLSLDAILGEDYFARTGGKVLCFGAGGSAVATLLHLISKKRPGDRPRRFILVNRSPGRLDSARSMVEKLNTDIQVEYICNADPLLNDKTMAALPPCSLVINATGMGKDTPGSPVTDQGLFPQDGIAWDFNYRGELDFLRQARAQAAGQHLQVEDGWLYFLHGWTQVVVQVLHIGFTPALFSRLAELAGSVR